MLVYLSTTLNTGHAFGLARETIILPVLARDEEPQPTTQESMFNYVRLSDGGPARHAGPRSEVEVIATLAEKVFGEGTGGRGLGNGEGGVNAHRAFGASHTLLAGRLALDARHGSDSRGHCGNCARA